MKKLLLPAAVLTLSLAAAAADKVMNSTLAGRWYDRDPAALRSEVEKCLAAVREAPVPAVMALIVPHAGYRYSGGVAACGYRAVAGKSFRRVIIIGVSHYGLPADMVSVPTFTHIATPLGRVPLDLEAIARLRRCPNVGSYDPIHQMEHSDQIQLPFLQVTLRDFKLVPVLTGPLSDDAVDTLAAALRELTGPDTLVIASSDFTHYGKNYHYQPFPVKDAPDALRRLDEEAFRLIAARDRAGFSAFLARTDDTICGRDPIRLLLTMIPAAARPVLLKYDTSGRLTGSYEMSVSYASFVVPGQWPVPTATAPPSSVPGTLSVAEHQTLLALARKTIAWYLEHGNQPDPQQLGIALTPNLRLDRGVFVTLHKKGALRGCIGEIYPTRPLYQAVIDQAVNAATRDYRFPRVTAAELKDLDLEISVLTPPAPVDSRRDIVLGRDGIILSRDGRSAVFLPQVAVEQKWDLPTTLSYLSAKAGLPRDAWKLDDTRFMVFQADVFGEKKASGP